MKKFQTDNEKLKIVFFLEIISYLVFTNRIPLIFSVTSVLSPSLSRMPYPMRYQISKKNKNKY